MFVDIRIFMAVNNLETLIAVTIVTDVLETLLFSLIQIIRLSDRLRKFRCSRTIVLHSLVGIMLSSVWFSMIMATTLWKKSMGVIRIIMQNFVHDNVNNESTSSSNEHSHRLLHKFPVNDTVGGLVEHKENQNPDDEDVRDRAK